MKKYGFIVLSLFFMTSAQASAVLLLKGVVTKIEKNNITIESSNATCTVNITKFQKTLSYLTTPQAMGNKMAHMIPKNALVQCKFTKVAKL